MPGITMTLAAGWQELIVPAIGVIIVVGSAISSALRKNPKQDAPTPDADARKARLEELAARRRQQLEALARGRQISARDEPDNLTVGQKQSRDQARTLYERRAEALRRQQAQRTQRLTPTPSEPLTPSTPPRERITVLTDADAADDFETVRASNQRRLAELSRVQQYEEEKLRERQRRLKQAEQQLKEREAHLGERIRQASQREAGLAGAAGRVRPTATGSKGGINWRQAVIMREILGRPVGLRPPADPLDL